MQRSLAAYVEQPESVAVWADLQRVRRAAAEVIAALNPMQKGADELAATRALRKALAASGAFDHPVAEEDLALAGEYAARGWPGLLAAMLLVPAWQWPTAPALETVPVWLWADFISYLFYAPQGFCATGQAEAYAAHYLRRLEEFARAAERARGAAAVRAALVVFTQEANQIPLYFSSDSLRRHAELRGRLLALAFGVRKSEPMLPLPRDGRRLRIGFVNRHFGAQTETYTTLPTFEQLDPERFEVVLFAHRQGGTPLEVHCHRRAAEFHVLSGSLEDQVAALRQAGLDVVVFGTNVTAVCNEVTLLALHRVAPLQVVNNSSCITSGLTEVDLYVSGDLTELAGASAHFSERLGLLPGPAHAFNYEVDKQVPSGTWTRAALGLPEDAIVFVTAANYFKIIPEMQQTWARLLAAVPGSRLLVHPFNPNWSSSYPIKRFCAEFDRVLTAHGVDRERLVVSSMKFPSRSDVGELLRVGDIYLDTFPFGGVNSLIDPLELAVPAIVWEGATFRSRMGAALLRSLGVTELIATSETEYLAIAADLAADGTRRVALQERIRSAMGRAPVFLDSLAASDAFGDLIETAYDELLALDHADFRAQTAPVQARAVSVPGHALEEARARLRRAPADPMARLAMGRALLAAGNPGRAVDYLLGAVQTGDASARAWFELAVALRRNGQMPQAIESLEVSLKLDQGDREAWALLVELAEAMGSFDLAAEAKTVIQQLDKA